MGKMRLIKDAYGTTEGFCLVKSAAVRTDVKDSEYLDMVLADSDGECVAKLWNYSRLTYGEYDAKFRSSSSRFVSAPFTKRGATTKPVQPSSLQPSS